MATGTSAPPTTTELATTGLATTGLATTGLATTGLAITGPATTAPAPREPVLPEVDVARLRHAILQLARRMRKHELANLTPTQVSTLATVARDGPLRLGDLAAAERIAPSTLTRLVAALEERGYLERGAVPGDARACLVSVTGTGTDVLDRIRQETTSLLAESLLLLPAGERAALAAALPALDQLADAGPA